MACYLNWYQHIYLSSLGPLQPVEIATLRKCDESQMGFTEIGTFWPVENAHDTTLSIYDGFLQNRFILPLLMILIKLLIVSNMAIHKWWVKASSALQHYYHYWTCLGHSIIPKNPTSAWICQWLSHRKHAGNFQTVLFFNFPPWIQ